MVKDAGEALKVKLGAGGTVRTTVVDAVRVPDVPVIVSEAPPELLALRPLLKASPPPVTVVPLIDHV